MMTSAPCRAALLLLSALLLPAAVLGAAPIRSPVDDRDYAYLELPNGLRALVVSDPDTDKAAASLDVAVGNGADPDDRPGLAHFLEHMLFLGTQKYPDAAEYQEFINRHGGSHNAYTAFENTNYFFDIDKEQLEPALDRFAQFFIAPSFDAEYVGREKNAVHSEYQARLKDDSRRVYAAAQLALNPRHPLSRFAVGSLDTLADRPGRPVRADLLEFYGRHYSADRMTVVVYGREPPEVLAGWVREKFSAVPRRATEPFRVREPLFAPGALPRRLDVLPETERRTLTLAWPTPPLRAHYREKPQDYIANLLGHEGPGSLLSALKQRGWADALAAGASLDHADSASLALNINLTREGARHVDAIIDATFAAIALVREHGVEAWRYDEQRRLADVRFRFQEQMAPMEYASVLADGLQLYAPEDLLRAPYLYERYDPELIGSYLAALTRANLLVTFVAPEASADSTERWYGTRYTLRPLAAGSTATSELPALVLPGPNPFVPERLAVVAAGAATAAPARVPEAAPVELWHQVDAGFREPRASFYFSVRSAAANEDARSAVLTELYTRVVKDELNEFSYPATLAGLDYDLYRHVRGFTVRIDGFDERQPLLLAAILERLASPAIAADRFAVAGEQLSRSLENSRKDPPYSQAAREVTDLLVRPSWTVDQRLAALEDVTAAELAAWVPRLLERIDIVALAHGNLDRATAVAMADTVRSELLGSRAPTAVPPASVIRLASGSYYGRELSIDHPDSALALYFQGPDKHYPSRAGTEILGQILSSPFFNDLRTVKQLGYVVYSGTASLLDVPGLMFVVQSPVADPALLETHVQVFLHDFRAQLADMDAATFASHKAGVLTRIRAAEDRLQVRSKRYWQEIDLGYDLFDSRERLAAAVEALTQEDLVNQYSSLLTGAQSRRLAIRSRGQNHATAAATLEMGPPYERIGSPETFGDGMDAYTPGALLPARASGPADRTTSGTAAGQ